MFVDLKSFLSSCVTVLEQASMCENTKSFLPGGRCSCGKGFEQGVIIVRLRVSSHVSVFKQRSVHEKIQDCLDCDMDAGMRK